MLIADQVADQAAKQATPPRLILASSSRYRQELLQRLRIPFLAIAPNLDETALPGETPLNTALRLAQAKAEAIAPLYPESLIIGSDQVAVLDDLAIGKPGSHSAALRQLQMMRGRQVAFHTALCLLDNRSQSPGPRLQVQNNTTQVSFRTLPDAELDAYLHIEQPYDCAGSAKNEGLGIALIQKISSDDPTALTGLPLILLCDMLRNAHQPFFN